MKLNKNAFPVNIALDDAILKLQKELNRRGHKTTVFKTNFHLNIVPFWVCFYDVDSNKDGVYAHHNSQIALNSLTNKIQDEYLKLLDYHSPEHIENIDISLEKIEIRLKKSLVTKEEAKETIVKMLSCKFEVDKKNVSLSGFEEMYIPIWKYQFEKQEIYFDAVVGEINNFNKIVVKEKNNKDLFLEMLEDLKDPKKVLNYIYSFFKNIVINIKKLFIQKIKAWKLILVVVLIIIILGFLFS